MALATQCPHCGKRFRVAADQLKLRGGIVRCGACHEIFDGNATLIDLDALAAKQHAAGAPAPAPAPAEPAPPAPTTSLETVVPAQAEPAPSLSTTSMETVVPAQAGTHAEPADTRPTTQPAPASEEPQPEPPVATPNEAQAFDSEPIYTLHLDHTLDPLGILPKAEPDEEPEPEADSEAAGEPQLDSVPAAEAVAAASLEPAVPSQHEFEPEPEPESEADLEPEPEEHPYIGLIPRSAPIADAAVEGHRVEPTFALPVDEELVAAPLPDHDEPVFDAAKYAPADATSAPLPLRESAPSDPVSGPASSWPSRPSVAESKTSRRSKLTPTKIDQPKLRMPETDEPEFVKRSRKQERSGKALRIAMAVGSVILLLVLAAQLVTTYRNVLAARFPAAKPALVTACGALGCRVDLPAQIDNLSIEQGELVTLGANAYSLTTLLHNQGGLAQAWPHIELTLTDTNDKPLLRRVFAPGDYLPQGAAPAGGFAPHGEQQVKLFFQLDQLKPSGYRIAIFYP